jgi:hypothetical protein
MPQHQQEHQKAHMRADRPDLVDQYNEDLARADTLRQALLSGPFPGMGTGDPDLYKAFCWRFMHLTARDHGRIGVVLPRSAFSAKGSSSFRKALFGQASIDELCYLINSSGWVFDDAEMRYTIVLTAIDKDTAELNRHVCLRGPYRSLDRFQAGVQRDAVEFPMSEVVSWTVTAALPLLPEDESAEVFSQLRKSPRLDFDDGKSWRARPHRELDATNDRKVMVLQDEKPDGHWPVFKGASFDIWDADRGRYFAWGDPAVLIPHFLQKRQNSKRRRNSVWFDFSLQPAKWFNDETTLPCFRPRIAFKDVVRNTDSRTMKVGLIPPNVFITNTGPYFLWIRGDEQDEAFLLGVLSTISLDWYSRRFVELHMNFFILNQDNSMKDRHRDAKQIVL